MDSLLTVLANGTVSGGNVTVSTQSSAAVPYLNTLGCVSTATTAGQPWAIISGSTISFPSPSLLCQAATRVGLPACTVTLPDTLSGPILLYATGSLTTATVNTMSVSAADSAQLTSIASSLPSHSVPLLLGTVGNGNYSVAWSLYENGVSNQPLLNALQAQQATATANQNALSDYQQLNRTLFGDYSNWHNEIFNLQHLVPFQITSLVSTGNDSTENSQAYLTFTYGTRITCLSLPSLYSQSTTGAQNNVCVFTQVHDTSNGGDYYWAPPAPVTFANAYTTLPSDSNGVWGKQLTWNTDGNLYMDIGAQNEFALTLNPSQVWATQGMMQYWNGSVNVTPDLTNPMLQYQNSTGTSGTISSDVLNLLPR